MAASAPVARLDEVSHHYRKTCALDAATLDIKLMSRPTSTNFPIQGIRASVRYFDQTGMA